MDALALLCTLHADGPATLKRLRARGYLDLVTLVQRSAGDLSADLDVEPAFARRLLREAKLLAVRVGAEGLEAEEAPPIATPVEPAAAAPLDSVPRSIPIAAPAAGEMASELNEIDRSLVERIVAAPKMDAPLDVGLPAQLAQAPIEPAPAEPMVTEPVVTEPVVSEPVVNEVEPTEICSLEAAALPGLDADLIFDLKASGITTIDELAQADSLQLTRALGVTFAQARRLGFLARRSAASLGGEQPQGSPEPARTRVTRREAPRQPQVPPSAASPVAATPASKAGAQAQAKVVLPEVTLAPHRRPAPEVVHEAPPKPERPALTAALAPLSEPAANPPAAPTQEPSDAPLSPPAEDTEERKPFWEPRGFLEDSVEPAAAPEQGVKVDPAEIAPRPRFGDRLAKAAEQERQRASKASAGQAQAGSDGHTVLGWNFEIPRPEDEPSLPLGSLAVPAEEESPGSREVPSPSAHGDQDRGGPFA